MKILKNNFIKILFSIFIFTAVISCDETGDIDPGGTKTKDFSGDWFISLKDSDGADLGGGGFFLHHTYNTSANDNTIWIDDESHGYVIKCKMTINTDGTFTSNASPNIASVYDPKKPTTAVNDPVYANDTVTITNGKIEKGAGLSKAGHKVDKITFTAHFSYDAPGYNIIHTGHKRTGFIEDEY